MIRERVEAPSRSTTLDWGNSAPLALFAFAVTTFMLSMVNAGAINKGVEPVVFGVALMFGGITQLIAGIIQLRVGNTFAGVLFSGFGAFWLSLFAIVQWFLKDVPAAQVGHAQGLFLYAFGIFIVVMLATSLRTNAVVVLALAILVAVFFARRGQLRSPHHLDPLGWLYRLGRGGLCLLSRSGRAVRVLLRPSRVPDLASRRALSQHYAEEDVKAWRT